MSDIVERLRHVAWLAEEGSEGSDLAANAADEIERLRAANLHEQHQTGTDLARLRTEVGAADALANTLRALVAEQHDEIERLRAAGDALAEVADEWPELVEAWQEARRDR